jgi:D-threonate/D-erythronate kinase
MTRLAVIADDLTGALDASAPFAARGLSTLVALGRDQLCAALASGADVIGVSTDSRELAPDAARQAVADCLALLPAGLPIFKKIDSRLKGNIAAELDAISFRRALVIPAIPAFGRWMRDGRLGGFGVSEPIDVAARLGHHAGKAHTPDVATQDDIDRALTNFDHDLPVGARGLAEALAIRLAPGAAPPVVPSITAPVICVIGSTDSITLEQIRRLRETSPALHDILAPNGVAPNDLPPLGPMTLLQATAGDTRMDPVVVARHLGEALLRMPVQQGATLFISGGATAQVVLRSIGIGILQLVGEALPGLPIARAGGFTIITKSGGFGTPDTLLRLLGHSGGEDRRTHG